MKTEILEAIAECAPYSAHELDSVYNWVESFDLVVSVVRVASSLNIPLRRAAEIMKKPEKTFCDHCWCEPCECPPKTGDLSDSGPLAGSAELLRELMDASAPYLRRKKMTPRHECNELNRVFAKCVEYLEKDGTK